MSWSAYAIYALVLVLAWLAIGLLAWYFGKARPRGVVPILLLGPAYFVLKRADGKVTKRESVWLFLLFLLMLVVPLVSELIER